MYNSLLVAIGIAVFLIVVLFVAAWIFLAYAVNTSMAVVTPENDKKEAGPYRLIVGQRK